MIEDLTAGQVREALDYDPDTGIFRWRIAPGKRIGAGAVAGCACKDGKSKTLSYVRICIFGKKYKAHRLAFMWMTGNWPDPKLHIDHIDRNGLNNSWKNLRQATPAQNAANTIRLPKSGQGVDFDKVNKKYRAGLFINGKYRHLGRFDERDEAQAIYDYMRKKYRPYGSADLPQSLLCFPAC